MKAGQFNIYDYLEKLNEEATQMMDGGQGNTYQDGIVIPDTNVKAYQWLKKEFQKGKVEVKVEMKLGDSKFEPGYDLQTDLDSVKDFKPGMFGEIKTTDTKGGSKEPKTGEQSKGGKLDVNKEKPGFGNKEGEKKPTDVKSSDSKKPLPAESKDHEEKESPEHEEKESKGFEKKEEKGEVKDKADKGEEKSDVEKIDLKTKKK
jgi:hypothetical protein